MMRFVGRFRTKAGLAHTIWALFCASLCIWLVAGGGSGHPPAIILLPVVLVIWCIGHIILWGIRWLAAIGRSSIQDPNGGSDSWPPDLIIILIGTGVVGLAGLLQLAGLLVPGGFSLVEKRLWAFVMAAAFVHSICFAALLLRRPSALWTSALICAGWIMLLLRQFLDQIVHGHVVSLAEYAAGMVGLSLLVLLIFRVLYSRRIRAFMGQ